MRVFFIKGMNAADDCRAARQPGRALARKGARPAGVLLESDRSGEMLRNSANFPLLCSLVLLTVGRASVSLWRRLPFDRKTRFRSRCFLFFISFSAVDCALVDLALFQRCRSAPAQSDELSIETKRTCRRHIRNDAFVCINRSPY